MEGCCWADLPEELLCLIFSNLFATRDRRAFRLVCPSWNSAAATSPDHPHLPCLMYKVSYTYKPPKRKLLSWKLHQYNHTFYLSEHTNARIQCSNFGWLLMHQGEHTLFFYDPFNNRRIEVPGRTDFPFDTMHFSHPPTSPHCFIVGIREFATCCPPQPYMEFHILKHGSSKWEIHKYNLDKQFWMSKSTPVLHDGLVYFSNAMGDVAVFDVHSSALTFHNNCLRPRRLRERVKESFLLRIEDDDAIFAVFVTLREAMVYKLLEQKMEWKLVNDLGDKVLYVSHLSSFGVKAPMKSVMENTINFAQLYDGGPVFYSLGDRKYHSFGGGNHSIDILCGHDMWDSFLAWISPLPSRRTDMVVPIK